MIIKYVDLSSAGSGHSGDTDSDAYTFDEFVAYLATNPAETTFNFWGSYSGSTVVDYYDGSFTGTHSIFPYIGEPWKLNIPYWLFRVPVIAVGGIIRCNAGEMESYGGTYLSCYLTSNGYTYIRGNSSLKGCLIENSSGTLFDGAGNSVLQDNLIKTPYINDYYTGPTSASFIRCAIDCSTYNSSNTTYTECQQDWTAPSLPAWDAPQEEFESPTLLADVDTPPSPGTEPYEDYEEGLWGTTRTDIGACFFIGGPVTDYYADLDLAGEGGDGTEGNPWHEETFRIQSYQQLDDNSTIHVKGTGEYIGESYNAASNNNNGPINLVAWGDAPFRIFSDISVQLKGIVSRGIFQSDESVMVRECTLTTCYLKSAVAIGLGSDTNTSKGCTFIAPEISGGSGDDVVTAYDSIFDCPSFSSIETFVTDRCVFTSTEPSGTHTNAQFEWTVPVAWPDYDAEQNSFNFRYFTGITTPPQPGGTPYVNYATGLWNEARQGIGGLFFTAAHTFYVDLRDTSTESPSSWLWEMYNRDTESWETLGTTQNLMAVPFDYLDPTYALVDGTQFKFEIRLTATNAYGSDTKQQTFIIESALPYY